MRRYEMMFLMNAALSEDERQETVERVESEIEEMDGHIARSSEYDVRELAYPIDNVTRAHYRLLRFQVDPDQLQTLKDRLHLVENLLRFLVIRYDNQATAFTRRRRRRKKTAPPSEAPEEEVDEEAEAETEGEVDEEDVEEAGEDEGATGDEGDAEEESAEDEDDAETGEGDGEYEEATGEDADDEPSAVEEDEPAETP